MKYELRRRAENIVIWMSWHIPRVIAYWCAIRVMTYKYGGNPSERSCADALKGW